MIDTTNGIHTVSVDEALSVDRNGLTRHQFWPTTLPHPTSSANAHRDFRMCESKYLCEQVHLGSNTPSTHAHFLREQVDHHLLHNSPVMHEQVHHLLHLPSLQDTIPWEDNRAVTPYVATSLPRRHYPCSVS